MISEENGPPKLALRHKPCPACGTRRKVFECTGASLRIFREWYGVPMNQLRHYLTSPKTGKPVSLGYLSNIERGGKDYPCPEWLARAYEDVVPRLAAGE
jgi:hypothetical protein